MRSIFAIFTLLALSGCGDIVTTRFASMTDAKSQGAVDRGWLPPLLPDSSSAIVDRHNLDLNTGTGSFDYDLSERNAYIERLLRAGAVSRTEQDHEILILTTNGSRWEIQLSRSSSQAKWSSKQP